MKKVSIIVPVYNMEKYLDECMSSLVNQTLDNIEIIAINDGSTDNSLKILKEYKKKYPDKVVIIDQKNKGISIARNNGIDISTGKYIGFMDSDDYAKPTMFEELYKKIEQTNSDIVVCDFEEYYMYPEEFRYKSVVENIKNDNLYNDPSIINSIDYGPCNKLFKKEMFADIKFPKNLKYEDLNTILKVFLIASKISTINKSLYIYRINNTGETKTINKKVIDILAILQDLIDYSKSIGVYEKIKSELKKMCVNKLFFYLIYSYKLNDKQFVLDFRSKIIKFLNKNFNNWKFTLLKNRDLKIKLISKLVLMDNVIFKYFISRKCS